MITSPTVAAPSRARSSSLQLSLRGLCATFLVLLAFCSVGAQSQSFPKYYELLEKAAPYRDSLQSASVLHDSTRWQAQSYMVPTTPDDVAKFLSDLAAVEKLMTGDYRDVEAPEPYRAGDIMQHPKEWLALAKARNEIIAKIQGQASSDKAAAEVKFIKGITAKIKESDGWGLNENGLKIVIGKREDVRKALCQGQKYPGWDEACDELTAAARDLAGKNRSYANHTNAAAAEIIGKGWAKNYPDRKILKFAAAKSDWTIVRDSLGNPKYRSVGMAVRYRVPGFDLVIEQTISILQDYIGGAYKYRPTAQVSDYRIVK